MAAVVTGAAGMVAAVAATGPTTSVVGAVATAAAATVTAGATGAAVAAAAVAAVTSAVTGVRAAGASAAVTVAATLAVTGAAAAVQRRAQVVPARGQQPGATTSSTLATVIPSTLTQLPPSQQEGGAGPAGEGQREPAGAQAPLALHPSQGGRSGKPAVPFCAAPCSTFHDRLCRRLPIYFRWRVLTAGALPIEPSTCWLGPVCCCQRVM
mmetsp:Transcript_13474/g.33004  ORF Transcript_13474/g.33004 Transcript_13474/m.33004 type:complete len:210 (+) Transcript_13474:2043-2672(+)